jgi:urease accessory protein
MGFPARVARKTGTASPRSRPIDGCDLRDVISDPVTSSSYDAVHARLAANPLDELLSMLPPLQRQVIELCFGLADEERTAETIAEALRIATEDALARSVCSSCASPAAEASPACSGSTRAPLHVYRPIYLDARRPDMAFIFVQQSGDGLVQGDRYRADIDCAAGAAAHITTQAATNVFRARENFATQLVNLRADAGSVLEYLPDPVVPFRGSRLFQRICLTADRESTVILGETLLPGRVAHGEVHAYDLHWIETEVCRPDGTLLFADVLRLNPTAGDDANSLGLLGAYDVVATLYVISAQSEQAVLVASLRTALADCVDVLAGVSELPNDAGCAVRLLGPSSRTVKAALRTAWNSARLALLGAPAPDLRKG